MFLHLLNDSQQTAFLSLAKQFIAADQHLSDEEHNLLELAFAETGLDFDAELPSGTLEELLAPFDSKQSKAAVLLELIGMGHADDHFHPEESAFVKQMATALNIADEEVTEMESWVVRQMALAQEVEKFWTD